MLSIQIDTINGYDIEDDREEIDEIEDSLKDCLGEGIEIDWIDENNIIVSKIDSDDFDEVLNKINSNEIFEDIIGGVFDLSEEPDAA